MLGVKSFDPCREFGCFQSLFFIVVDHCGPFTLAVVKSQVVLRSPFVERFHCIPKGVNPLLWLLKYGRSPNIFLIIFH